MPIETHYLDFSHIEDAEGRRLCDLQGEGDVALSGSNCIACWRCASLRFAEMEAELARLRRENEQLIEAAKQGALRVSGDFSIPPGTTIGFLFVEAGTLQFEGTIGTLTIPDAPSPDVILPASAPSRPEQSSLRPDA